MWEAYFEPNKPGSYWYTQYERVRKTAIAERNERVILQDRLRAVKAERNALKEQIKQLTGC